MCIRDSSVDSNHEASLRALVTLMDASGRWERAGDLRQQLAQVLEGEAKAKVLLDLGQLAREKLKDPYQAIDAYSGALKLLPESLEVLDALYVLLRETRQSQKAADMLQRMLRLPALSSEPNKARRVWFALGELRRDELRDVDGAAEAFNTALDLDHRFIEAFSALEAMLGGAGQWRALEENYAKMIGRMPKTPDTHGARMGLWRALGDLYRQVLKNQENAVAAYGLLSLIHI